MDEGWVSVYDPANHANFPDISPFVDLANLSPEDCVLGLGTSNRVLDTINKELVNASRHANYKSMALPIVIISVQSLSFLEHTHRILSWTYPNSDLSRLS